MGDSLLRSNIVLRGNYLPSTESPGLFAPSFAISGFYLRVSFLKVRSEIRISHALLNRADGLTNNISCIGGG